MRMSYPKPMETMERITRQYLCDHFDEILEQVDKEDIGFVILNEEGKDGEVLIPYRWTECFVDEDFGVVVNSALRYAIEKQSFMTAGVINFVRKGYLHSISLTDGYLYTKGKYASKITAKDLPEHYIAGVIFKSDGYISAKGIKDIAFRPNYFTKHLHRDDHMFIS